MKCIFWQKFYTFWQNIWLFLFHNGRIGTSGKEPLAVGEPFRTMEQLLDEPLPPAEKPVLLGGVRGQIVFLAWITVEIEHLFRTGSRAPNVLEMTICQTVERLFRGVDWGVLNMQDLSGRLRVTPQQGQQIDAVHG